MAADKISNAEFKDALGRYPTVLDKYIKPAKEPGDLTLADYDKFRYIEAPSHFSKKSGGNSMTIDDLMKLTHWKLNHGTYRPGFAARVKKNKNEDVAQITSDAFAMWDKDSSDIESVINKLTELQGIGPSAASLLLSIHDPEHVIFFSDEAYAWLCNGGTKSKLLYKFPEFEALYKKSKELSTRLKASPMDIEKVAFVLIREKEPVKEPKAPYVPSGLPRGRPNLGKGPYVPNGKPRGRPAGSGKAKATPKKTAATPKTPASEGKKRGRPAGVKTEAAKAEATPKSGKRKAEEDAETPASGRAKRAKA